MNKEEVIKKVEEYFKQGETELNLILENGERKKIRLFSVNGLACVRKERSKYKGYYADDYFNSYFTKPIKEVTIVKKVSEEEKWLKSINKAIGFLEKSELWSDILTDLKLAREIGFDKINEAYKIDSKFSDYRKKEELIKQVDERLVENGNINRTILWHFDKPLKIKKMYFGKEVNEHYLNKIKEALQKKEKYSCLAYTNYDVSFEYSGENRAWYSEEYKGMGNGHYYLALNETHAVFWEDD